MRDEPKVTDLISERDGLTVPSRINAEPSHDRITRMRIEEYGTSPLEIAQEHLEDYRPGIVEALKLMDRSEFRDLHVRLGAFRDELDAICAVLEERRGS